MGRVAVNSPNRIQLKRVTWRSSMDAASNTEKPAAESTSKPKGSAGLDWVTARSNCSLPKVFATLRRQIEADVKTRNSLRPDLAVYEFSMVESGNDFTVLLAAGEGRWSVVFSLHDHSILARDSRGEALLEITLNFNQQGECRLRAKEQEWEYWQIRRMALEDLMFRAN